MDEVDILLDEQDADATARESNQKRRQFINDDRCETLARFIKDEKIRIGDQRPADCEHLLLPAGQRQTGIGAPLPQDRE